MADGVDIINAINKNLSRVNENINANLNDGFNEVRSNLRVIDNHVITVDDNVRLINSEVAKLAADFAEFVQTDIKQKALIRAEAKIGNLRDKLKDQFGHHETVRKHTVGILQADDLEIVRKETITTVTEELMLAAPGYWLAPCLVAISAWINDNEELADRAVREAIKRDDEKTSLLFGLICRRAERKAPCLKWIQRYLANQDEERLDRKTVIILDAFASGLLGADSEGIVARQLEEWLTRLADKAGFVDQQTSQWSEAINLKKKPFSGDSYTYLKKYSKTWSKLQKIMEGAHLHEEIYAYFENIFEQQSSGMALREQLDEILSSLVTDFDEEEIPLRQEYKQTELVIEYDGDENRAKQDMQSLQTTFETHKDFTQLLTDAAMKPETAHASISTQKFAIALSRDWISNAYNDIVAKNRMEIPHNIEINVDNFNDNTVDGKNEAELVAKFEKMVAGEISVANAANTMTVFEQYCMYGGIGVAVIGLLAMLNGGGWVFLGLLGIAGGIGLILHHFSRKKAVELRRQQIAYEFDKKKKDGVGIIRAVIAEVVDFRAYFAKKDSESTKVLNLLEQIKPEEYVRKLSDTSRRLKVA
ncbi:MAG: hypothetical protein FWG68_12885 [Defluviitaleaceae bacterium]|nr:hypothetical protein [Defluviitaleaceae bacterium]